MADLGRRSHWERVKEVFQGALTLPADERATFLSSNCGADEGLRSEVESLLRAHEGAGPLLEGSAAADLGEGAADPLLAQRVGPYRVLAEIGRGGMGAVYCAVRDDDAFLKTVALKVLRGELSTDFHRESFHRERQILAGLEHPNVAQLLDGGTTDDGRPYLVMELVAGEPIDLFCERHGRTVRQRLELFLQVCAAVQHAHQNLVVHRDLKPGNILVTADGVPKLLDFGIAKLLPAQGGAATVTQIQVLTPLYASPEQLLVKPITTATDVYSLGVVLYELLTGRRPFDFDGSRPEELFRRIDRDPPRPSKAAESALAANEVATVILGSESPPRSVTRTTPRAGRARELRGDLDTIVMTALAREPERRYGSVAAFAEDVRRHLEHRPIAARPPTLAYRAGKFLRRHPGGTVAAALVVASLLGGMAATTAQWRRAEAERVRAQLQADRATAVTSFLEETLGAAHPESGMGRDATVLEALAEARTQVDGAFADSPDIHAAVQAVIGETYGALGRFEEGEELLRSALAVQRRALGDESLEVAETRRALGDQLVQQGKLDEAERLLRRALAVRESLLGPDHVLVGEALNSLGTLYFTRGDIPAAVRSSRRAVVIFEREDGSETGKRKRRLAVALGNLAASVEATDAEEAIRLYRRAIDQWRALGLMRSAGYAGVVGNLGLLLRDRGEMAAAEPLLREALALDRDLMGERHPNVAISLVNLGSVLRERGEPAAARPLFVEAIAILEEALGGDHWMVARAREGLGVCWLREGRLDEAERELLAAHAGLSRALGPKDERTQRAAGSLAELYENRNQPEKAARYRPPPSAG